MLFSNVIKIFFCFFLFFFNQIKAESPISTLVLDTSIGKPASNVPVILERKINDEWILVSKGITGDNGRLHIPYNKQLEKGTYKLTFYIESYLKKNNIQGLWIEIPVIFLINNPTKHYHIPLLFSPFGYSTYLGV